jgi:hypothetical protein
LVFAISTTGLLSISCTVGFLDQYPIVLTYHQPALRFYRLLSAGGHRCCDVGAMSGQKAFPPGSRQYGLQYFEIASPYFHSLGLLKKCPTG